MTEAEVMQNLTTKTEEFLGALDLANKKLTEEKKQQLASLVGRPVGLRDTNQVNVALNMPSRSEITNLRRELASAVAAEKWQEGFVFALQLVSMMGGL